MAEQAETMRGTVASMLRGIERYNPENIATLERYVELQARENTYDLEANLALLKLYQFNPGTYQSSVACQILMKALTNLHTRLMEEENIKRIMYLHDLLEMCQFRTFWEEKHQYADLVSLLGTPNVDMQHSITSLSGVGCTVSNRLASNFTLCVFISGCEGTAAVKCPKPGDAAHKVRLVLGWHGKRVNLHCINHGKQPFSCFAWRLSEAVVTQQMWHSRNLCLVEYTRPRHPCVVPVSREDHRLEQGWWVWGGLGGSAAPPCHRARRWMLSSLRVCEAATRHPEGRRYLSKAYLGPYRGKSFLPCR
ncbi:Eukaryotic translation initiation factor 3 subunit K [Chionoecetes opilio]|uniref:Eukaryotic translation initiation factor 3 subunit K n=1 Tax=Chionoecetes opilio TaxID=41210 RepID=A0A8J5CU57_CHIOP|nr:Eukaryotic translation initiation factor 3 subunit K [Chionoecetes opilio]